MGIANGGESWVEMPAADAVAAFSAGQLPINVVDLPIGPDIDPDDRLTAPALMSHGNLLMLRLRSRYGEYRRLDRIPLAFSFAYHPIQTARFVLRYLQGWEA